MSALLVTVMLVMTPDPTQYCDGFNACAVENTVYMRGDPPIVHVFQLDLTDVHFPHFANNSLMPWRKCADEIRRQVGFELGINQWVTLAHEISHVAGNKHP